MMQSSSKRPDFEIIEEDYDSYSPRPITSGPTQYSSHGLLSTLVWGYMVLQFFVKVIVAGSFLTNSCLGCNGCHFCVVHFFSYLILAFNVWPLGYLCYKQHLTLVRFKGADGRICNWGFLFFIIDCLWISTIAISSLGTSYKAVVQIIVVPSVLLLICNVLVLYFVTNFEVDCYDPFGGMEKYFLQRRVEECPLPSKWLTVKESSPFRIVLQNCGTTAWDNPLIVTRHISWTKISSEGRVNNFSEKIEFPVYLKEEIEVGDYLTLIPETHTEPGSHRIQHHRSFGMEKGEMVVTSAYIPFGKKKTCVVRLVEEFKKDKMRAKQTVVRRLEDIDEEALDEVV